MFKKCIRRNNATLTSRHGSQPDLKLLLSYMGITVTKIVKRLPGIGYDTPLFSEEVDVKNFIFRVKFAVPT